MKKITISDVAFQAGVSVSTVSRVLNNYTNVASDIAERVNLIIKTLGYVPNTNAQNTRRGTSDFISIILPTVQTALFSEILQGAMDATLAHRLRLVAYQSNGKTAQDILCLESVAASLSGGLIYCPVAVVNQEHLSSIRAREMPSVIVARRGVIDNTPHIYMDNVKGCYTATKYLLQLGRRRIAFFAGFWEPPGRNTQEILEFMGSKQRGAFASLDRLQGYINALNEYSVEFDPNLFVATEYNYKSGYAQMKKFLATLESFDAVICANDWVASGVMQALLEQNITVPDQVSIIGYDDGDVPQIARPTLTSVRQSSYEIGRQAVELLIQEIAGNPVEDIILETSLSIRNSTAAKKPAAISGNQGL